MQEWERGKEAKRKKHELAIEETAGQPNSEHKYWKNVTRLQVHTSETIPDQDIQETPHTRNRQMRTEGSTTYCYEPNGRLIGTVSTAKAREHYILPQSSETPLSRHVISGHWTFGTGLKARDGHLGQGPKTGDR